MFTKFFPEVYSSVCFPWLEKRFDEKQGFEQKKNLKSFSEVEFLAWRLSGKFFREVVKTALYVSGKNFEEFFSPENFSSKLFSYC